MAGMSLSVESEVWPLCPRADWCCVVMSAELFTRVSYMWLCLPA